MGSVILASGVGVLGVALVPVQGHYQRKQRRRDFEQHRRML